MEDEMEICSNCKREIPSLNYVMHSVHCHRNIAVCPQCKEPVPHSEMAQHRETQHGSNPCKACGELVENSQLTKHESETCSKRRVACIYCELDLVAAERAEHENYCGSRTEKCEECGEFVMLKYQTLHIDSNHGFIKLSDEPGPQSFEDQQPATNWKSKTTVQPKSILKEVRPNPILASKVPNLKWDLKPTSPMKRENHQPHRENELGRIFAAPRRPLSSLPQFMTDSDDEEELAAALVPPMQPKCDQEDVVQLPCEFCMQLVPASRLVLHQTGCRPDLARLQPTNHARMFGILRNDLSDEHEGHERPRGRPEDMIPCDLCGKNVEVSKFMQHQLACEIQHLPGRQPANRPHALVMPLSGRTLVSSLIQASSPPDHNLLLPDLEHKTSNKTTIPTKFQTAEKVPTQNISQSVNAVPRKHSTRQGQKNSTNMERAEAEWKDAEPDRGRTHSEKNGQVQQEIPSTFTPLSALGRAATLGIRHGNNEPMQLRSGPRNYTDNDEKLNNRYSLLTSDKSQNSFVPSSHPQAINGRISGCRVTTTRARGPRFSQGNRGASHDHHGNPTDVLPGCSASNNPLQGNGMQHDGAGSHSENGHNPYFHSQYRHNERQRGQGRSTRGSFHKVSNYHCNQID
ncbi:hypothetical protein B566_EDAN005423 [Ephemera danica]|nr:hypothetical protein B566_EDAN005423 [Ephemera danica]